MLPTAPHSMAATLRPISTVETTEAIVMSASPSPLVANREPSPLLPYRELYPISLLALPTSHPTPIALCPFRLMLWCCARAPLRRQFTNSNLLRNNQISLEKNCE